MPKDACCVSSTSLKLQPNKKISLNQQSNINHLRILHKKQCTHSREKPKLDPSKLTVIESARANPPPIIMSSPHCTLDVSWFHVRKGSRGLCLTLPHPPLMQHISGSSAGHINIDRTTNIAAVPSVTYLNIVREK